MTPRTTWLGPVIPLGLYLVLAVLLDTGTGNWDGVRYAEAAFAWNDDFPYLGDTHWALRHPLVMPMAASLGAFGPSTFALMLPNLIYGAALILATHFFASRALGNRAAFLVTVLVATSPSLVLRPLEIEVRGPEVFFAAMSLWVFLRAADDAPAKPIGFVLSGVFAGLSWLCRESAGYLVPALFFAAVFLAAYGDRLRALLSTAAGFGLVIACELVTYALIAGDAFYRYKIDLGHGGNPDEHGLAADLVRADYADWLLEPFQRLLRTDVQGALALIVLAAVVYAFRRRARFSKAQIKVMVLFGTAGALSLAFSGLLLSLELPRYYPMLIYAGCVIVGVVLAHLVRGRSHLPGFAFAASMACAGFVLAEYRADYTKRVVGAGAVLAQRSEVPFHADPRIGSRITVALRLEGMSARDAEARVHATGRETLEEGDLVLHFEADRWEPKPGWQPVDSVAVPWKLSHRLLRKALPDALLPDRLHGASLRAATLYRVQ
ncbi:ArnT family glycosyltransferase [Tropicimonas sp. S265A]|uniref:ArnT family glycosyltransferase n=1 Tax=Tropicimonas sp. S265A TaxID=3415134 RepID=UPI003C7D8816